jgi:nicotinate phosphoribosyltransferase
MEKGRIIMNNLPPTEIAEYVNSRLRQLPDEHKRFENPSIYKVGISKKLLDLRSGIIDEIREKYRKRE